VAVRRSWAWVVPVATAAFVLVLGLGLGWWSGPGTEQRPARPFSATASLSAQAISFGDPLAARVDVLVDPALVDPASVSVHPTFGLYRIVGTARRTTHGAGDLLSFRYALECLGPSCAPLRPRVQRRFPAVLVAYRTRSGAGQVRSVAWPPFQLASRVTAAEKKAPATSLEYDAVSAPPTYRISPGPLQGLAAALAAVLVLAACALAWIALRPAVAGASETSESRLQQALQAVRASSRNGRPVERRKALGWLGRELRTVQRPDEADEARRLAWSASAPTGQAAGDFAARVETAQDDE
jgi:hypothetical protein